MDRTAAQANANKQTRGRGFSVQVRLSWAMRPTSDRVHGVSGSPDSCNARRTLFVAGISLKTDGLAWHDGRNCVLINHLRDCVLQQDHVLVE